MKRIFLSLVLIFPFFSASSLQAEDYKGDHKFIENAVMGNMYEISLGKIALQKAYSADVKNYGQSMIDDHTRLQNELLSLAQKNNIIPPVALDKKLQEKLDKVSSYSGTDFDKKYMKMMIEDHEKDLERYKQASKNGQEQEVRDYALNGISTLKQHQRLAKDIKDKL